VVAALLKSINKLQQHTSSDLKSSKPLSLISSATINAALMQANLTKLFIWQHSQGWIKSRTTVQTGPQSKNNGRTARQHHLMYTMPSGGLHYGGWNG